MGARCWGRSGQDRRAMRKPPRSLAADARAAGAWEAEITEAVEVGDLFGGTAALVIGVNAFTRS